MESSEAWNNGAYVGFIRWSVFVRWNGRREDELRLGERAPILKKRNNERASKKEGGRDFEKKKKESRSGTEMEELPSGSSKSEKQMRELRRREEGTLF